MLHSTKTRAMIKKISPEATVIVRNPVLRPNLPPETCYFEGDKLPSTTHWGYFDEEKLVGIVSVFKKSNPNWDNKTQSQIRGMAVLDEFQKKGVGQKLVQKVIQEERNAQTELIWFNARINAVPFYKKLGFQVYGTAFEIENIGTHYQMYCLL